ncbi:hypothetical protein U9M48_004695 [Paspalum notatum var. saurae]|uniref:Uncharacterized protein n=1 Tax=Paspalum notatum var. saurae TaxID=547442 RepID=A0AAQ3PP77_PASNO
MDALHPLPPRPCSYALRSRTSPPSLLRRAPLPVARSPPSPPPAPWTTSARQPRRARPESAALSSPGIGATHAPRRHGLRGSRRPGNNREPAPRRRRLWSPSHRKDPPGCRRPSLHIEEY